MNQSEPSLHKKNRLTQILLSRHDNYESFVVQPSLLKYFCACAKAALPMLNIAQLAATARGATTTITRQSIILSPLQLLIYLKGLLMQNHIYPYSNVPAFLNFFADFSDPL